MRIAGIIAEYNPFHNGHLLQMKKIRRKLQPQLIIVAMSGDFTQRGEPAMLDKWTRAKMALLAGADLVVELPYVFAVGKADTFAGGAVSLLNALGVNTLVFGSEEGSIEPFLNGRAAIDSHSALYQQVLTESLQQGISYPNAHAAAYRSVVRFSEARCADLRQPNNSLGFQYISAIGRHGFTIQPLTFKREQAGYHDALLEEQATIASAMAIRAHIAAGSDLAALKNKLPAFVYPLLTQAVCSRKAADWQTFFPFLKYRLLSATADELKRIYEAEEGIEHRLLRLVNSAEDFSTFLGMVKTKRYTWVRLQRLCTHILTGTLKSEAKSAADAQAATYIRPLAMTANGQAHLSSLRKALNVPLIGRIRSHRPIELTLDVRAAQIYDFLTGRPALAEFTQLPLRGDH
ncbi:MAG: nucleotidyltransferase [Sporolactobacillus sp.]